MTTKPTKATPTKAAKATLVKKTTTTKATKTTAMPVKMTGRTPRAKKTTPASAVIVRFPQTVLGYLEIALQGPVGPGGIAHRRVSYPITTTDPDGYQYTRELLGGACLPTTTRQVPGYSRVDERTEETVPTIVCRSMSAGYAQAHGVTRCTNPLCWPLQPSETGGGQ